MADRIAANSRFFYRYVRPAPGRVLVVGSKVYGDKPDRRLLYPNAEVDGLDMEFGRGVDILWDLERDPGDEFDGIYSHVDCASVLEHVRRPWLFAENVERLLRPGGTIYVLVPWVWRYHGYPKDYWRMTPDALGALFPSIAWRRFHYSTETGLAKRVRPIKVDDCVYFPRTELLGFGVKSTSVSRSIN